MKRAIHLMTFLVLIGATGCNDNRHDSGSISDSIPSLEELSGVWVSSDTVEMEPSIRNFRGQALLNRDMTSISWFVSAPFSGGYHTGTLRVNGKTPKATSWRWQPWQGLRKGTVDGLDILSSTRMLFDRDAVMWQVDITNSDTLAKDLNLELDLIGFISKYGGDWQWWYPYPKMSGQVTKRDEEVENIRDHLGEEVFTSEGFSWELIDGKPQLVRIMMKWPGDTEILGSSKYHATAEKNRVLIHDSETDAVISFSVVTPPDTMTAWNSGATASWSCTLSPGETRTIKYLMSYGDDEEDVK
jgi:hypothetical protein